MLYELVIPVGRVLSQTFFRLHVIGLENVPKHGPGLVCSNHCSYLDPMLATFAIPRKVYSRPARKYQQPLRGVHNTVWVGAYTGNLGLIKVPPTQTLLAIMDHGDLLLSTGEGTRSLTDVCRILTTGAFWQ